MTGCSGNNAKHEKQREKIEQNVCSIFIVLIMIVIV